MIMITSPAGVRLAKAGKALEAATDDIRSFEPHTDNAEHSRRDILVTAYAAASDEYRQAMDAVLAELYEQNLHEMTG